jgi:hypothetical protein
MNEELTYKYFCDMSDNELGAYYRRFFPGPYKLQQDFIADWASGLENLDEGHLAFSIEMLSRSQPRALVPFMPRLLADSRVGVWTAASRSLLAFIPKDAITSEQLQKYLAILAPQVGSCDKDSQGIQMIIERFKS